MIHINKVTFLPITALAFIASCIAPSPLDELSTTPEEDDALEEQASDLASDLSIALQTPGHPFVLARYFGLATRPFTLQGEGNGAIDVAPPPGYAKLYPLVEIRGIQVGDKDMGVQIDSIRSGAIERFRWTVTHAPAVSYGVPNLVIGRVSMLGLASSIEAVSGSPHRVTNGRTITWPTTAFASGPAKHWLTMWSLETGLDDDVEIDSQTSSTTHSVRMWNGNGYSFADVQSVEIVPTSALRVDTVSFDVYSGTRRSYSISRTAGRAFAVLAGASSYITCGADQFSFQIDCPAGGVTCTVRAWGGNSCSHVRGSIVLLEN